MIPGFTGNKRLWGKTNLFFTKQHFNCHPVTLPLRSSLTKKPKPNLGNISTRNDINFLRGKIADIRDELGNKEKIIGMGHSRGALLALMLQQEAAQKDRKLFDKIILITPATPAGINIINRSIIRSLTSLRPIFPPGILSNRPVRRSFKETVRAVLDENMPEKELLDIYNNLCWESGKVVRELLSKKPKINPTMINVPVLVVGATRDKMIPPKTALEIATMLNADYREIYGPHLLLKGPARQEMCKMVLNWF